MLLRHARLFITVVGADAGEASGRLYTVVGADAGDETRRIYTVVGADAGDASGRLYTVVGADAGEASGRLYTSITERFLREFSQVAGEFTVGAAEHGLALVGQDVLLVHENNPQIVLFGVSTRWGGSVPFFVRRSLVGRHPVCSESRSPANFKKLKMASVWGSFAPPQAVRLATPASPAHHRAAPTQTATKNGASLALSP
jgi:hypothetical protein